MSTATAQVFGTAELLEEILSHLSPVEITRAKGVCRDWRDVVANTRYVPLKQALFLKAPANHDALYYIFGKDNWTPAATSVTLPAPPSNQLRTKPYPIVALHPALKFTAGQANHLCNFTFELDYRALMSWHSGQWEKMLLTQPPCNDVKIDIPWEDWRKWKVEASDPNSVGLTLGDLRNAARDLLASHEADKRLAAELNLVHGVDELYGLIKQVPEIRGMTAPEIVEFFEGGGYLENYGKYGDGWRHWYATGTCSQVVIEHRGARRKGVAYRGVRVVRELKRSELTVLRARVDGAVHESSAYYAEALQGGQATSDVIMCGTA